jgi:hypothetical protein
MESYYKANQNMSPTPTQPTPSNPTTDDISILSEFDHHRLTLLVSQEEGEGWQVELHRYLKTLPANVTKDTDIVEWWQVCVRL